MTTLSFALPDQSFLYHTLRRCHYIDRCQATFADSNNKTEITDMVQAFFSAKPFWLRSVLGVKNKIAARLGLPSFTNGSTTQRNWWYDGRADRLLSFPLELFSHSPNEIVLGGDDKHLSFRVSFFMEKCRNQPGKTQLAITTMVQFNNARGRLCFLPVQPFHKLVVTTLLHNAIHSIKKKGDRKS